MTEPVPQCKRTQESFLNLTNATAIGFAATVNASNKIRLGSAAVTVIEGQVAFANVSDKTKKENFQPVDGEEVLGKIELKRNSVASRDSTATIRRDNSRRVPRYQSP